MHKSSKQIEEMTGLYLSAALSIIDAQDMALATRDFEKMLQGLRRYFAYERPAFERKRNVVWEREGLRIYRYENRAGGQAKDGIFLVPSMINGSEIMDLLPDYSFVNYLTAHGYDVYMGDWSGAYKTRDMASLNCVIAALAEAFRGMVSDFPGQHLHGFGYCMGGLLLLGAVSQLTKKERPKTLAFLATPWRFDLESDTLSHYLRASYGASQAHFRDHDVAPFSWMQPIFIALDPHSPLKKFAGFTEMQDGSDEANRFVAIEDWVNSGPPLATQFISDCMESWYGQDGTPNGRWRIGDRLFHAKDIDIPAFVCSPVKDRLVPHESAMALAAELPQATSFEPDCGHIAAMVGSRAKTLLWQPYLDWLQSHL
ncbi:MAG: hypothetical protein AB7E85_02150 [Pseudobdellovibrionaceae bacterium]